MDAPAPMREDKIPPPTSNGCLKSLRGSGPTNAVHDVSEEKKPEQETPLQMLNTTIKDARRELVEYLVEYLKQPKTYGGRRKETMSKEARAVKVMLAAIDVNGDGNVMQEEYEKCEQNSIENINQALGLLLNVGVVAALILSITYPLCISELTASDAATGYFTETTLLAFVLIYYILIVSDALVSLMLIYLSLRIYLYLGFWISQPMFKLKFLDKSPLPFICLASTWNIRILLIALPFGVAVNVGQYAGLIAVVICTSFAVATVIIDWHYGRGANNISIDEVKSLKGLLPENVKVKKRYWNADPFEVSYENSY